MLHWKGTKSMNKVQEYESLLNNDYIEAINQLLRKYGSGKDDYYRENSYKRFLNGEIKNITRGKYSRTNEGLYCHHIDEINMLNVSNKDFIKQNNISHNYQKKDRLVYCNLIEHTILHVLIAKETSGNYGFPGYEVYLKPIIEEWYIEERIPNRPWMKNCYSKAFVHAEEAVKIVNKMQNILGLSYSGSLREYYDEKEKKFQRLKVMKIQREAKQREMDKQWRIKEEKRKKEELSKKIEEFYSKYPQFKDLNILFNTPREKVLTMMFNSEYNHEFDTYKDFRTSKLSIIKDELLEELYILVINNGIE